MGYLAKWGPKGFIISPEKIVTFDGLSTSIELKDDSQDDTSGKAPTNTTGKKKQVVNLSITYVRAAGVDPRGQFEEWESLVGESYSLYIGGRRFGPNYLILKKVDLSDVRLANDGTFLMATVAVSFEEFVTTAEARRKNAAQNKQDKLLEEKEQAMTTADSNSKYTLKPKS